MGTFARCPSCKRDFGLFRWRYECTICQSDFCDDCMPKKSWGRRCPTCLRKNTLGSASAPSVSGNPVLDAAMRRREREQMGRQEPCEYSVEKRKLLDDIFSILKEKGRDEPFGICSMDETKLRSYLRHIKSENFS
ncbi:hypothetical protein ERJ75_000984900 [Trypanosoma vivax]|uniref:FYVE-type domain-containing protein n=1 Tax=Trypanosoma vivax (strain Y486) TaxID=1055687 RepID=G0U6Y7_TRYVY|nr:hypothetical protein TRVL_05658 [Trypanosoma vivax]KAH8611298.1 hypothetical protein ERJ75_000984900 [Trypanosoma vivax]CCC51644.1 conserved hypothetical protein [Trypanosoma vivax Y486]